MSTPHPALESAIVHFAQQPDVTPAEVRQLRATLASDPALTQSLETSAASGALHGFTAAAPGAPNQPVGHYDLANRTMMLPASAFTSATPGASADLHGVLRVQSMVGLRRQIVLRCGRCEAPDHAGHGDQSPGHNEWVARVGRPTEARLHHPCSR